MKCRPNVPDNIRYRQVFGNDEKIEDFLQSKNEFECTNIDIENDDDSVNKSVFENGSLNKVELDEINEKYEDTDVLHLKNNVLPRGLVPLEDLFYFNNVAKKPKIEPTRKEVEECNIGTEEKPKMIKLSKSLPP
jgi:hypothetical protein